MKLNFDGKTMKISRTLFIMYTLSMAFSCATLEKPYDPDFKVHNFSPELISTELEKKIIHKVQNQLKTAAGSNPNILSGNLKDYAIQLNPFLFQNIGDVWAYYGVEIMLVHRSDELFEKGIWKHSPIHGTGNPETLISTIYTFHDFDILPLSDGNQSVWDVFDKFWEKAEKNDGGATETGEIDINH